MRERRPKIIHRMVCIAERTTESRSANSQTFQNVVQKRNPHINLKIEVHDLNRRRRLFSILCKIHHIYQGERRQYAGKCACVYGVGTVKKKIENETNLTDCTSNLT